MTKFSVLVSCSGGEETFIVSAKSESAAKFDALQAAEKAYPFASDFKVEEIKVCR